MNTTDELIHRGFVEWTANNQSDGLSDEDKFTAGAKFIINSLIEKGKL